MVLPLGSELVTLLGSTSLPIRTTLLGPAHAPVPVPCPLTPPLPRLPPRGSPTLDIVLAPPPPPVTPGGSQCAGHARACSWSGSSAHVPSRLRPNVPVRSDKRAQRGSATGWRSQSSHVPLQSLCSYLLVS